MTPERDDVHLCVPGLNRTLPNLFCRSVLVLKSVSSLLEIVVIRVYVVLLERSVHTSLKQCSR